MTNDQDNSSEKVLLKGNLKVKSNQGEIEGKMTGSIVAILNLSILKFTFSGSRIERVAINLKGNTSSSNFKDDISIHRSVKTISHAKNL